MWSSPERGSNLLERVAAGVVSGVNGESALHRLLVQGPDHNAGFVVEGVAVALNRLRRKELSGDLPVLAPAMPSVNGD